jgi:BMFP domain-containing protein YqiC
MDEAEEKHKEEETVKEETNEEEPSETETQYCEDESKSFKDIFSHLTQAANIAASMGEERVTRIVGDVQDQLKKISQKGHKVAQAARDRVSTSKESVEDRVEEVVHATLDSLKVATRDDIERLENLIRELKKEKESGE